MWYAVAAVGILIVGFIAGFMVAVFNMPTDERTHKN